MVINQVPCLEYNCSTKTATILLSGCSLSVRRLSLLYESIAWILLGHKLSFGCRWKNSTVNLLISCTVYFVGNFLGTALSLWPRNLITRMSLSLGVSIYHLVVIISKRTFVNHYLSLVVRRFGFEKLIGIREFHLSCFTDVAAIIIWIAVFGFLYLHWGFYYSVRCSIGSIIICVLCFHILFLPIVISRWFTLSRNIVYFLDLWSYIVILVYRMLRHFLTNLNWTFLSEIQVVSTRGVGFLNKSWSMKIWVCSSEVGEMCSAKYFLNLRVINLIKAAQLVFLEPKRCWSFKMLESIIFKWIFIGISFIMRRMGILIIIIYRLFPEWILLLECSSMKFCLNPFDNLIVVALYALELFVASSTMHIILNWELAQNIFINVFRYRELSFYLQKSFKFCELSLESHVRKDYWPSFTRERECIFKSHFLLLHQISNDTSGTPTYTCVAMYKDPSTASYAIFDESDCCREMTK